MHTEKKIELKKQKTRCSFEKIIDNQMWNHFLRKKENIFHVHEPYPQKKLLNIDLINLFGLFHHIVNKYCRII